MFKQSLFLAVRRIDPRAFEFLTLCGENGIDARLVGGCVRDALLTTANQMNLPDIDIAINAAPSDVIAFCKTHRLKCIPTGIAHGTLTILFKGLACEVTSLRADIDTHGRSATVAFGASFEEDAKRRDFTMNALLVDHQHILYDAFDGVNDLRNGRVRFIGNPDTRIAEDYLRLYRYFRFWGRFGKGPVDISVLPALTTIKNDLSQLSIERVQSELFKILSLPWPGVVLTSMMNYGLLNHVCGDKIDYADGIKAIRKLVMFERFGNHLPCVLRRLCALAQGQKVSDIFKFSRAHKKKCDTLNKVITDPHYEIALTHPEWWVDSMLLKNARSADSLWLCREQAKTLAPPPAFPLTGSDVMAMGITGAKIGEVLIDVKRQWISSDFVLDRDACLSCLAYI